MIDFVPRTCTEIGEDGQVKKNADKSERTRLSFEEFRGTDAYVLLGPPGAGKTTVFTQEADCSKAHRVTARDFITFDDRPEWHNTTLFIDGLDEKRAGSPDGRQALDGIRGKLDRLGRPRFRLSCREADWFGANDRERLKAASRNGQVTVLRLDPLNYDDILKILRDKLKVDDPEQFVREAHQKGLETLLANPQSLEMLVDAVRGGGVGRPPGDKRSKWPAGHFFASTTKNINWPSRTTLPSPICWKRLGGFAPYSSLSGARDIPCPAPRATKNTLD